MSDSTLQTVQLMHWLQRIRAGDSSAREELVRAVWSRVEQLTHKMLRGFPNVRRWEDTADVMQGAMVRLLHTLQNIEPEDKRSFHGLIATHIRRELLDLARKYGSRERRGILRRGVDADANQEQLAAAADEHGEASGVDSWARFHEEVERLPPEEREVVGLVFYHGWTQGEVAELFQVSERTVRRYWQAACLRLHESLQGQFPAIGE